MTENITKAVEYHKSGFSCSAAVLNAFRDEISISEIQAMSAAKPMAGGRMIKCGAVLAAEYVLRNKYDGDTAERKISEFEQEFTERNKSVVCRELKGIDTGKILRSCRGCVSDSAGILEKLIRDNV